jgi:putative ABC transport system substrate-binding protein
MTLKRRDFITLLGGAAAWPVTGRAQQAGMPVIGYLSQGSPGERASLLPPFHKGLSEMGIRRGPQRNDRIPLGAERPEAAAGTGE